MVGSVGITGARFPEAVKAAINKMSAGGYKPAWFEVTEQRGAIADGRLKEFQVKMKFAVAVPQPV